MPEISGHKVIADMLHGYGVTAIFHVPYILDGALMEMEKHGIKRVRCHSEKAAAYMADGYARISHRPGIAMAQSVGAANLAAGLQDAYLAVSPVIALTGRWTPMYLYRHAYQEIDHRPLFDPVTKFNGYVDTVDDIPFMLRQAFREATTGAPGPVHLDVLGLAGELAASAETDQEVLVEETYSTYPAYRPRPDPESVSEAVNLIKQAKRPILIAGGGVTASGARKEVLEFAVTHSIPVATSLNGKGTIPEDHPLSAGVVGTYSRKCANQIVNEADLVIYIGSHTGGQVSHFWQIPSQGTRTIQIDIDPAEIGRNYPASVGMMGDAKSTIRIMLESMDKQPPLNAWLETVGQYVQSWRNESTPLLNSNATPIRPERLCREISDLIPDNAVVVSDTGHAGIWTGTMIELTEPGQTYLRCAGSLGWGFPAALGAKCAAPDRPVICFTGDGGFWYHLSELETAARFGINTITVVNNNRSFNQCKGGFDSVYEGQNAGKPEDLWVFEEVNFVEVAKSMGCLGIRVDTPSEIRAALEKAMTANKPVVIDVSTDIEAMAPVAFVPE